MGKCRQAGTDFSDAIMVEVGNHQPRPLEFAVENFAPGIDDHAVAVRQTTVFMAPALTNRQQVALVFDGAGGIRIRSTGPSPRYNSGKRRS